MTTSAARSGAPTAHLPLRAALRLMTIMPQTDLAYRASIGAWLIQLITQIYLYVVLWRALFAAGQTQVGIDYGGAVTYSTLAVLQSFSLGGPDGLIRLTVRDGSVSYYLLRPLGYLTQLFALGFGSVLYGVVWTLGGFTLASMLSAARWPEDLTQFGYYLVSLLLAQLVHYQLRLLLGLTAFWTTEVWGISTVFQLTTRVLSGAIVPLWFLPDGLRGAIELLPFASVAYVPLSIFVGRLVGFEAHRFIMLQALWVCLLMLGGRLVWRQAERKVVVQGG